MLEQDLICLNPVCKSPRKFKQCDSYKHHECIDWIVYGDKLQDFKTIKTVHPPIPTNIKFEGSRLRSLFTMIRLKNMDSHINKLYEDIKNDVVNEIDKAKNKELENYKRIYEKSVKAYEELLCNVEKINQKAFNLYNPKFQYLEELLKEKCLHMNNEYKVRIDLANFLESKKETNKEDSVLTKSKITDIVSEEEEPNKNIEIVSDLIKNTKMESSLKLKKISEIMQIEYNSKISFDQIARSHMMKCWFCSMSCLPLDMSDNEIDTYDKNNFSQKNKKQIKKGCERQLFNHMIEKHRQDIIYFKTNVFRNKQYEIQEFIDEALFFCYETIFIVDRENCGQFKKGIISSRSVWIEVVNRENKKLVKSSFICATSRKKDAADLVMIVLIYELMKKCNFKCKIVLITQDHFGNTFKEVTQGVIKKEVDFEVIRCEDFLRRFG